MNKKEKVISFIFLAMISIFFIMFYVVIHPIVLFDSDDWINCCSFRDAIPLYGAWNPGRILPEIMMPLCSKIGAYVIHPLFPKVSLFRALTYAYALNVTAAIVLVVSELYALVWTKTKKIHISIIGTLFFVLSIFWFFRSEYVNNIYLLSTRDLSTYYVYVIPNLFCSAALLMLIRLSLEGKIKDMWKGLGGAARIVLLYFCIFSNLWASVIIGIYVSLLLLRDIYNLVKKKEKVKYQTTIWKGVILVGWLVAQFIEATGGRASYAVHSQTYVERMGTTIKNLVDMILKVNKACAVVIIAFTIYLFIRIIVKKDKVCANVLILGAINIAALMIYNVITCNKVDPEYIKRVDVLWGALLWIILIEIYAIITLCEYHQSIAVWLPLGLILIFCNIDTKGKTFDEALVGIDEPEDAYMICEYIAYQLKSADDQGVTCMDLIVPKYGTEDNWPIATYVNSSISDMAYEYGITSHKLKIETIIPTENITIPQFE